MMPASQDFRDGAATGAAMMAVRLRNVVGYGITPTYDVIDKIAETIVAEYGGKVYRSWEPGPEDHTNGSQ
jgi:hypothetical protein